MSIEINGKIYRNIQEQVGENQDNIEDLDTRVTALENGHIPTVDAYTKAESDAKFQTKIGMALYATQQQLNLNIAATEARTDSLLANKQDKLTAGTGIDITNNEVSIDNTVALKSELNEYIKDNDTNYASTFRGKGVYVKEEGQYTTTIYGDGAIGRSIPRTEGYTYTLPSATGTLALTSDIPNYTGGSGITINSGNVVSADSTLARVADIPSITGLTMYNYKITISGLDGGNPSTPRSAVYIVSLPYQWDYSSLSKIDIIRRIPVWSVVVDTDTSANSKNIGRFHWQTGAISLIDWVDGTHTVMDFTGAYDAKIEPAAPAHW